MASTTTQKIGFSDWNIVDIDHNGDVITEVPDVERVMRELQALAQGRISLILVMSDERRRFVAVNADRLPPRQREKSLMLVPYPQCGRIAIAARGRAADILGLSKDDVSGLIHPTDCPRDVDWKPKVLSQLSIVEADGAYIQGEPEPPVRSPASPHEHVPARSHTGGVDCRSVDRTRATTPLTR
jgi:hypothetical protein